MEVSETIIYGAENGSIEFDCSTGCIMSAEKNISSIAIPNQIDGVTVISIANNAFQACTQLEAVKLPSTLTKIGYQAFKNCTSLERVTIPRSVNETGNRYELARYSGRWFEGCSNLVQIILEDGITRIPDGAFAGIPTDVNIVVPSSIVSIGAEAFKGTSMTSLETILANIVTNENAGEITIGASVFENCTQLKSLIWADVLPGLPNYAFYNCTALEALILPHGVTSIGYMAFRNCTSLKKVTIPQSVNETGSLYELARYSGRWFEGCSNLVQIVLEDGTTIIPEGAYAGIPTDVDIVIPGSIMSIGEQAFQGTAMTSLKAGFANVASADAPETVTIGASVFKDCNQLKIVEWPEFSSVLPNKAFQNCTALETLILPSGITSIGYLAFNGCTNLKYVKIPQTVKETGKKVALAQYSGRWFEGSSNLLEAKLEEGISKIPDGAFAEIQTDFAITIPESVKEIGAQAFYNCSNLTSITIPKGVKKIGEDAFKGCNNLTIIAS